MNILAILGHSFSVLGGLEIYNHVLCNQIGNLLGKDSMFVIPMFDSPPASSSNKELNYTIHSLNINQFIKTSKINFIERLRIGIIFRWTRHTASILIANKNIDFIIAGSINVAPICYALAKRFQLPYSICTFGIEIWRDLPAYKNQILKSSDLIITMSNYTKLKLIEKGVSNSNIFILPGHVNTHQFRPEIDCSHIIKDLGLEGKKVLLTIGSITSRTRYKGQDIVLKALPKILKKIPNTVFLIIGSGDDEARLRNIAQALNITKSVLFLGPILNSETPKYYNAADVFIMPSRVEKIGENWTGEGFGIVYIEANACAKPVISGRAGGAIDAVEDGVNGLLIDPTDPDEVANAVIKLLLNETYARKLGEQGRKLVEHRFSFKKLEKRIHQLLTKMRDSIKY